MRRGGGLVLLTLCAIAALAAGAHAAPIPLWAERAGPYVDGRATYPEDSLAGVQATLRSAVPQVDVRLTADGVPVLMHDATLDRVTDCGGAVSAWTLAQLAYSCALDIVGSPGRTSEFETATGTIRIPTLGDALSLAARAPGTSLVVRLPADTPAAAVPAVVTAVVTAVDAAAVARSRILVQTASATALARLRDLAPSIRRIYETKTTGRWTLPLAQRRGVYAISPPPDLTRAFVDAAHRRGLLVVAHDVNDPEALVRIKRARPDAIVCLDPSSTASALAG